MDTTIEHTVRTFLAGHFGSHELRQDEDIFAAGYVTSMFAMQLVLFIEQQYGLRIGPEDLILDNFRTIDAIADLIRRRRG